MWARARRGLLTAAACALAVAGCAAIDAVVPHPEDPPAWLNVYGARVFAEGTSKPASEATLKAAFEASARYWGTAPDALAGWAVIERTHDAWNVGDVWVWGISYMDLKRVDFATPRPDCPALVLVHEWGHAGANILDHSDPRFEDPAIYAYLVMEGVCHL